MSIPQSSGSRKYAERPASCRVCGSPAWWNGWRKVTEVVQGRDGACRYLTDRARHRARCSKAKCRGGSWTIYPSDSYPHRFFSLCVVVSAVNQAVKESTATLSSIAKVHMCSRPSVSRWLRWFQKLVQPEWFVQACAQLDPDGEPPANRTQGPWAEAGSVFVLLNRFSELLLDRGVPLPGEGPAIARLLTYQLTRFGNVYYLIRPSPPLFVDLKDFLPEN